ncbi:hypothetical protein [Hoeflea prorocentri]|uniref:Uncharacterized protein n=1 Tax=Hoeflea prorocentri TaxID=1922333 RepID=A0A9X3UJ24_9HYPH|nr:hypothetical protein [Hoeflea prorocentri]MCY6381579.1 hypothetical protein [Hoeflea prorocentri]MDA5399379.1 hypothetical protein [Hoeflea prorocentri]
MTRKTLLTMAAAAFVSGSLAGALTDDLLSPSKAQASGFTSSSFKATCVSGFKRFGKKTVNMSGVPVIVRYKCRTAWIQCPNFPNADTTVLDVDIKRQGSGDDNPRTRIVYTCKGQDIAG